MRSFNIASILALSALVAAQGEEGISSAVEPAIGSPTDVAGGDQTTSVDPAVGGGASATESLVGTGGEPTAVVGGDGGSMTTAVEGVGDAGASGVPSAVAAFTSQNAQIVQSLLSQGAIDPSGAAIGAQALLSSAYQDPQVSSYIANDPTWSALAAQVTGAAQGGESSLDPAASGFESASLLPEGSSTASQVVVTSVNTPRNPASATNNAPKASGSNAANSDEGSGAMSIGVKVGSIALAFGTVLVATY